MADRIEPHSFFFWDVFCNSVSNLFNKRRMSVIGQVISKEIESGKVYFLRKRVQFKFLIRVQVRLEYEAHRQFTLNSKIRVKGLGFQPGEECF